MPAEAAPETVQTDVLVIGAGGAGMRGAIAAAQAGRKVTVVCKSLLGKAHTVMAEGGMAAALANVASLDSWEAHFADTMKGGKLINNWRMAELHAKEAPACVLELERWGAVFDRTHDGLIHQRRAGVTCLYQLSLDRELGSRGQLLYLVQDLLAPLDDIVEHRAQGQRPVHLDDVHPVKPSPLRIRHPARQPHRFGVDILPADRHQDLARGGRMGMPGALGHQCWGPRMTRRIRTYAAKPKHATAVPAASSCESGSRVRCPAR